MTHELNWEYEAPRFVDFTDDIDCQLPGNSFFDCENAASISHHKQFPDQDPQSVRTSTPEVLRPKRISHNNSQRDSDALKPLRVPRESGVTKEILAPLATEEQGKITPDVSLISEMAEAEDENQQPVLQQRTSTPDMPTTHESARVLRSTTAQRIRVMNNISVASPSRRSQVTPNRVASKRKISSLSTHNGESMPPKRMRPQLTVPKTPTFMRENRMRRHAVKSTNHSSTEKDSLAKKRADEKRKLMAQKYAERSRKRSNASQMCSANTSQSSTFLDVSRVRAHPTQTRKESSIDDFVKNLRSLPPPSSKRLTTTIPVTPKLSRGRLRSQGIPSREEVEIEETKKKFKARGVVHAGIPFIPKITQKVTVMEPFSVDSRSREMMAKKDLKIRNIVLEEKRARQFFANPMPCEPDMLPEKLVTPATQPEPFRLQTDTRGQLRQEKWNEQIQREQQEEEDNKKFRATRVTRSKFTPQASNRVPTEFDEFAFDTTRRFEEKRDLVAVKRQQEQKTQLVISEQDEERQRREMEELAQMRAQRVIRATEISKYKPVNIKKSDRPITEPRTPKFSKRFKK